MPPPPNSPTPLRRRLELSMRTWERALRSRQYGAFAAQWFETDPLARIRYRLDYLLVTLTNASEEMEQLRRTPLRDLAALGDALGAALPGHVALQHQDLRSNDDRHYWSHGRVWLTLTDFPPADRPVCEIEWTCGPELALGAGIDCPAFGDEIGVSLRVPLLGVYVVVGHLLAHLGVHLRDNAYRHVVRFRVEDGALWWYLWANAFGEDTLPWWRRGRLAPLELLLGRYRYSSVEIGRRVASVALPESYYTAVVRCYECYSVRERLYRGGVAWRTLWRIAKHWTLPFLARRHQQYRFDFERAVPIPDQEGAGQLDAISVDASTYEQAVQQASEDIESVRRLHGWKDGHVPLELLYAGV